MLIFLIGSVLLGLVIYFFFFRNRSADLKVERVPKKDPAAQKEYEHVKHEEEEKEQKLTLEEKVELSWQFLTNITEMVLNRFSAPDKQQIHDAGIAMQKNGMEYLHDVDLENKQNVSRVRQVKKTRKKKSGGRGR